MISNALVLALFAFAPADSMPRLPHLVAHPAIHAAPSLAHADSMEALLHRALGLMVRSRYQAARDLYRHVARQQTDAGASPVVALRRVADTYYFAGDRRQAAVALLETADVAASYGDVAAQAEALVDAAVVFDAMRDVIGASESRARATRVLGSAFLPAERAGALRTRLATR